MTSREVRITKTILDVLHNVDGSQLTEALIHGEAQIVALEKITLAEIKSGIELCESRKWVTGIKSKYSGYLYNITDAGEAARLEMR